MILIVPSDLSLKQSVGAVIVLDFFVSQQSHQAFLKSVETAFDLTFGLGIRRNAMGHAHGCESALKLGVSIQAVGGGSVAEQTEPVGVKAGRQATFFNDGAEVREMGPGRV